MVSNERVASDSGGEGCSILFLEVVVLMFCRVVSAQVDSIIALY